MPHEQTRECVKKAKLLVTEEGIDRYYYASLQLRMGIEYLFYELLALHREELPDDVTKKWQPKDVLNALLDCDPTADQDGRIVLLGAGPDWATKIPLTELRTKAPKRRLLKDHWHRLGSYLHAPINLVLPELVKWKVDLEDAIATLSEWDQPLAMTNINSFVATNCMCCHRAMKRNVRAIERVGYIRCPDSNCGAIHDVELTEDGFVCTLRECEFNCPSCETTNHFADCKLKDGLVEVCSGCGKSIKFIAYFRMEKVP